MYQNKSSRPQSTKNTVFFQITSQYKQNFNIKTLYYKYIKVINGGFDMNWKKLGKVLLFPHFVIMILLIPIATVFLIYSMIFLGTTSISAIISYVLAFYTLTVWCVRIPFLIHFFKTFKNENKYARIWQDERCDFCVYYRNGYLYDCI